MRVQHGLIKAVYPGDQAKARHFLSDSDDRVITEIVRVLKRGQKILSRPLNLLHGGCPPKLETESQRELHLTIRTLRRGDAPRAANSDGRVRQAELRMIQPIEEFRTELQFARFGEPEFLRD